jgi:hypothetical protein
MLIADSPTNPANVAPVQTAGARNDVIGPTAEPKSDTSGPSGNAT